MEVNGFTYFSYFKIEKINTLTNKLQKKNTVANSSNEQCKMP